MQLQIAQKELEAAAVVVSTLVDRTAGPLPVLSNLLIEATEKGVQFRGSDMESLVTVNVDADVRTPGRTTIPADVFRDIVKVLPPNAQVALEETDGRVLISSEKNEYKLMTLPADDFPEWPATEAQTRFQISQKVLKTLIDGTSYALPNKDHRRVLLGVYFELTDHNLRLTATDGKKLARISTAIAEVEGKGDGAIIVPRKLLENVARNLSSEGPVEIELSTTGSARQIAFRFANVYYRGNGIDGKYPDCDNVIPKEFPNEIPLNRDVFLQAARRAGITTEDKNKSITLKFENNACGFSSMAHDLGAFSGRIGLDYSGPTIEVAFNYQFLIETLSRFASAELTLRIKNSNAPVVFVTKEEENRLALLMPIKVSDARASASAEEDEDD